MSEPRPQGTVAVTGRPAMVGGVRMLYDGLARLSVGCEDLGRMQEEMGKGLG